MEHAGDIRRRPGDRRGAVPLAVIFAGALALRLYDLGGQSFWADEALTIGMYTSPPGGVSFFTKLLYDVHGPLFSLLLHFWSIVSSSEAWLRLPSAIMGALSVPLLYLWLERAAGRRTALLGALFLALSPFSLYYSQELRFYSMVNLFSIVALISYVRFDRSPTARNAVVLGVVLALACLSHFSALFLCLGLFVHSLITGKPRGDRFRKTLLAGCVLLVIISPWIYREIVFLRSINVERISEMPADQRLRGDLTLSAWSYPYLVYAFGTGYSFGPGLRELHAVTSVADLLRRHALELIAAAIVFGGVLASAVFRMRSGKFGVLVYTVIATALLCLTAITFFNIKVFNVRYLMPVFPLFVGALAAGIPRRRLPAVAAASAVCAVMIIADMNYFFDETYARDDIRGAVEILEAQERPGDAIVLQGVGATFYHYYDGENLSNAIILGAGAEAARAERIADEHGRAWNIRSREYARGFDDAVLGTLSSRMRLRAEWRRPGVVVYLFESGDE